MFNLNLKTDTDCELKTGARCTNHAEPNPTKPYLEKTRVISGLL